MKKPGRVERDIIKGIEATFELGEWCVDLDRYTLNLEKVDGDKLFVTILDHAGKVWKRFEVSARLVFTSKKPFFDNA